MADKDRYDEMAGPALAAELTERELPLSGKVDELRARLRADDADREAERSDGGTEPTPEGEEAPEAPSEVPEPREPVEYAAGTLVLTEDQARQLTAGEAKLRAFTKHVNPMTARKYIEGDRVIAVLDHAARRALVLPFGIEVELTEEEQGDGLEGLRQADAQISGNED